MAQKGVKHSVIALHYPYSANTYKWFGIDVYALGGDNQKGLKRFLIWRQCIRLAKRMHQKEAITHVQSFWMGECTWLGNKISNALEISHACTLMGQDVLKPNPWFKRISKLPPLIALSRFHQQKLKESFELTAKHIIPWGIEESEYLDYKPKSIDILGVGNFSELKNYSRFLHIVKLATLTKSDLKVCLIGDGEERKHIEKLIIDLELQQVVELTGFLSHNDVLEKMRVSKSFLHCSAFESFGMVIIEAINRGVKVYSTPVGIAADLEPVIKVEEDDKTAAEIVDFLKVPTPQQKPELFSIHSTVEAYLKSVF